MGYQLVKLVLHDGNLIRNHTGLNAKSLLLNEGEEVQSEDIKDVEPETKLS
jgi:hypothetical protein